MAVKVRPTKPDRAVARWIARHATPRTERAAQVLTLGADEHLLYALALAWWLCARGQSRRQRRASDHVLLTTVAASVLPHLLKRVFDQERPDRLMLPGHRNGVPYSGRKMDAFPSGHAIHMGALVSAATELPPQQRNLIWCVGAILSATRIVLLAHWASDVLCGLLIGGVLERAMRLVTGYGRSGSRRSN
jgi:undecaprenyl-diphosphatase